MKQVSAFVMAFGLLVAPSIEAQQKPAEKETAQEKTKVDPITEMAARQAEAIARAQQKVAEEARRADIERVRALEAKANELIPVDVEVVISRYQGDKKISSLPYFLAVNAGERQQNTKLRMGANVPVPSSSFSPKPDQNAVVSYTYQNVGTNIDCSARPLGDGRFVITISVSERSVVQQPVDAGLVSGAPVIRNFESENNLVLRDGQTRQFTAAADRVTGEVIKVDVTLKVVK